MKNLIRICEYILFIFFFILIIFLNQKIATLLVIPVLAFIYFFVKKVNIKHYAIFIFITSFVIRIFSIFYLKVDILDDFKTMYEASLDLINGDLSFVSSSYFQIFGYQIGHVLYQGFLLKIINNILFLKIINSIITSFIVMFIYLISKKMFKEKTSRFVSLLYLFYLYPVYLNSVLTNQHLPALLIIITIYLLFYKKVNYKLYIVIGCILAIANFFRTESIIIVLGIIIYNFCFIKKNNINMNLINSFVLVLTYLSLGILIQQMVYISPLKISLKNNAPEWKFYCGLNDKYNGIYNDQDDKIYFSSSHKRDLLKTRIRENKWKLPILFLKKEVILWTQTNYDIQILNNIDKNLFSFMLLFNQGFLNFIIILFIISLIPGRKMGNKNIIFLKIIVGIYYLVYMFIEISPRYAYILHILIFLMIGLGIERLIRIFNLCKNKVINRKSFS